MKKESIIAIIFGIGLGLVVAIFLLNFSQKNIKLQNQLLSKKQEVTPSISLFKLEPVILEIEQPNEKMISKTNQIKIKGKATKGNFLLVNSVNKQEFFPLKKDQFELDIPLNLGENIIHFALISKEKGGVLINKSISVYYLPESE